MQCQRVNSRDVRCTNQATHVEVIQDALGTMVVNLCNEHKTVRGMSVFEMLILVVLVIVVVAMVSVIILIGMGAIA